MTCSDEELIDDDMLAIPIGYPLLPGQPGKSVYHNARYRGVDAIVVL